MKKILTIILLLFVFWQSSAQVDLFEKKVKSQLNIPFQHFDYNTLEGQLPDTIHTALKPWHYDELPGNIVLNQYKSLLLRKKTWLGRKIFNEHLFAIVGPDYWLSIDPVIDWRLGKDNLTNSYVYQNTRAVRVEGALGDKFSFSSTIAENYAKFPAFFDRYAWTTSPHILPGYGLNKSEKPGYVDYPYAAGYMAYRPGKFFFFELGHGKHFIGEGYRSLFLSDNAPNYPYFKVEAQFWHIKFTTMWTAFQDLRPEYEQNGVYRKKFSAIHYLSWNATKKLNLGFFESVIWYNENRRGFDVNFLNPLIFFKTAEYEAGSDASNTVLGLSARYRLPYKIDVYGQFLLDEMVVSKFFNEPDYWTNKYAYQLGIKYHQAFSIPNLFLRLEYNLARPYTYAHNTVTNYGHDYQALAHPWGANFKELLFEAQYQHKRWFVHNITSTGKKGFDFPNDPVAYGGDIYHYIRLEDKGSGKTLLQGNLGRLFFNKFEAGYILNPATNLKVFGGLIYRQTKINVETDVVKNETSKYIYFGIKTHLWNDHFDVF